MVFEEKEITLKNGAKAVLKTPQVCDAQKMLKFIKTACGETEFLARYPEEWECDVEKEVKWIENCRNSPSSLMIACYIDGEIAGNCEINFRGGMKTRHRSVIAIALISKYWNLGIGSHMFEEMLAEAASREGVEMVELGFIEGNDRARRLYEKFGFQVVSKTPNAYKLRDGSLVDECYMQKYL